MKKILLTFAVLLAIAVLLAMTSTVFAASSELSTELQWKTNRDTKQNYNQIQVGYGYFVNDNLKFDGLVQTQQEYDSKNLDSRIEAGITYGRSIYGPVSASIRGGIGQQFVTTGGDYTIYNITPAVSYDVTKQLLLNASYKYENAFNNVGKGAEVSEWAFGPSYKMGQHNVGVNYFYGAADDRSQGVRVRYAYNF